MPTAELYQKLWGYIGFNCRVVSETVRLYRVKWEITAEWNQKQRWWRMYVISGTEALLNE